MHPDLKHFVFMYLRWPTLLIPPKLSFESFILNRQIINNVTKVGIFAIFRGEASAAPTQLAVRAQVRL